MKYILSILSGVLWRLGGSGLVSKLVRRIGVPIVIMIQCLLKTKNIFITLLTGAIGYGVISIGYGIPNSAVAKAVLLVIPTINDFYLMLIVRAIIGFCYGLICLPVFFYLKKYKKFYFILLPIIVIPLLCIIGKYTHAIVEEFIIGFYVSLNYGLLIKDN